MSPRQGASIADAAALDPKDIFDLQGAYDSAMKARKRDDRQGHFHPSSIGFCGRKNVYEYIRAPYIDKEDPDSQEIFDLGHAVHELVQDKLAELKKTSPALRMFGYSFQYEVPFDPETDHLWHDLHVGGTTDGILEVWCDAWRQRSIIEIKSIGLRGFEELKAPKPDHVLQAHLYAYRFDCPIIYVWYYCKNNSKKKIFPLIFKQEIFDEAVLRVSGWLQHATAGTLPEREFDWLTCKSCEYRNTCAPPQLAALRGKNFDMTKPNLRRL